MTTSDPSPSLAADEPVSPSANRVLPRTLVWLGIAGASAALTFAVLRATMRRAPVDPTSARIQSLIDEANRLMRALDDQKHG